MIPNDHANLMCRHYKSKKKNDNLKSGGKLLNQNICGVNRNLMIWLE